MSGGSKLAKLGLGRPGAALWGFWLGRVGSSGGISFSAPGLLGGLLKGEVSSTISPLFVNGWPRGSGALVGFRLGTGGFSSREAGGGGAGFGSLSLRISTERLGGGGEGGSDDPSRGDLGVAIPLVGVSGRLGILSGVGDPLEDWLGIETGSRKGD